MGFLATPAIVRADGYAWPLETFLDSHGFERRPSVSECRDRYAGPVEILDEHLDVHAVFEARQIDWHSVIAVKAGSKVCEGCRLSFEPEVDPILATHLVRNVAGRILVAECRTFTVNSFEADFCVDCQVEGDWEY